MVSETAQVNIGNKYLSTKEAFDKGDHDFVSRESFIPKECKAKRGDNNEANFIVVKFRQTVIRSQNKRARIVVENKQQQALIGRRFTPLEEEQHLLAIERGECFKVKVSQTTLNQSYYLQKRSRPRNAGKLFETEFKIDLNLNFNFKVKGDEKKENKLHFRRLKTLIGGKSPSEASFKRPPQSYLALLLNLLLTVLAFSPLISSVSSPSLYALDWRAPEGAKLLVSSESSRSFSRQQRQISPTWTTSWTPIQQQQQQQQQYQLKHLQLNQHQQHQISHQNVPYKTCK